MKKFLLSLTLAILFTLPAPATAFMLYQNPEQIIVTTPAESTTTTAAEISILGAAAWGKPLYLDGQLIETTSHGFFTARASLNYGQNTFTLTQDGQTKTLHINRQKALTTSPRTPFSWDNLAYFDTPIWGAVRGNNITHRALPNSSPELLNALAQGTLCRIIGEYGDYYCLTDHTFVRQSSLKIYDAPLDATSTLQEVTLAPQTASRCTEINLLLSQHTLYAINDGEQYFTVTLYDCTSDITPQIPVNPLFDAIDITPGEEDNSLVIQLHKKSTALICGYYAEVRGNYLVIGCKLRPAINGGELKAPDLSGAVIMLDAGHGGEETGAPGPPGAAGPMEKSINLVIAFYTKERLEQLGATVIMTRSNNNTLPLADRVAKITEVKPDLSISIHSNSLDAAANYADSRGCRVYYTYDTAAEAANYIASRLARLDENNSSSPIRSNLALTRIENCPAILVENAFMSNPADYEKMLQSSYQQEFGAALGDAAASYLLQKSITSTKIPASIPTNSVSNGSGSKLANSMAVTPKALESIAAPARILPGQNNAVVMGANSTAARSPIDIDPQPKIAEPALPSVNAAEAASDTRIITRETVSNFLPSASVLINCW